MNIENLREYCLKKPFVTESFPFDSSTLVFKVGGKMFALADVDRFSGINLKAEPDYSTDLRERYAAINPGFHMNKTHWNTVDVNSDVPHELLYRLIDHSYTLVYASLSRKLRNELEVG
jgi:predicted DNA-binding protein (MmcQ/YjbR family)